MAYHCGPNLWIDRVAQDGYEKEETKQEDIDCEYDDRYPVKPHSVVRQVVEEYRYNSRAHCDGKPSNGILQLSQ